MAASRNTAGRPGESARRSCTDGARGGGVRPRAPFLGGCNQPRAEPWAVSLSNRARSTRALRDIRNGDAPVSIRKPASLIGRDSDHGWNHAGPLVLFVASLWLIAGVVAAQSSYPAGQPFIGATPLASFRPHRSNGGARPRSRCRGRHSRRRGVETRVDSTPSWAIEPGRRLRGRWRGTT